MMKLILKPAAAAAVLLLLLCCVTFRLQDFSFPGYGESRSILFGNSLPPAVRQNILRGAEFAEKSKSNIGNQVRKEAKVITTSYKTKDLKNSPGEIRSIVTKSKALLCGSMLSCGSGPAPEESLPPPPCCGGSSQQASAESDEPSVSSMIEAMVRKLNDLRNRFRIIRARYEFGVPTKLDIIVRPRGPRGYTGPGGIPGEAGERGPPGDEGPKGDKGPQGWPGLQGEAGRVGAKGMEGSAGEAGRQGIMGQPGPLGRIGATGPQVSLRALCCSSESPGWPMAAFA